MCGKLSVNGSSICCLFFGGKAKSYFGGIPCELIHPLGGRRPRRSPSGIASPCRGIRLGYGILLFFVSVYMPNMLWCPANPDVDPKALVISCVFRYSLAVLLIRLDLDPFLLSSLPVL